MEKRPTTTVLSASQLARIREKLLEADRLILAGRYLAAERILKEILAIDPYNDVALSYQERIRYLTKQLMQRVSLSKDVQAEIRKAKDVLRQKKMNEVNSFITRGKILMDKGNYLEASKCFQNALNIDPENVYAKALLDRIEEISQQIAADNHITEAEIKFNAILRQVWRNGVPTEEQETLIRKAQREMNISDGRRLALERKVKNFYYKEALREVWLTGGIAAFYGKDDGEALRKKYGVSLIDYSSIEAELIREVRKNKVRGVVLVADKDETLLVEVAKKFRLNSYAVLAAVNFDEALSAIKTMNIDVILSEINLGEGTGGFELFTFVRSNALTQAIPFFLMSSTFDRHTLLISRRLGVDDLYTKPLDYELLLASLTGKLRLR